MSGSTASAKDFFIEELKAVLQKTSIILLFCEGENQLMKQQSSNTISETQK